MKIDRDKDIVNAVKAEAEQLLASSRVSAEDALRVACSLQTHFEYDLARRLLDAAMQGASGDESAPARNRRLRTQLSLCTYKDEQLLPAKRFKEALAILDSLGLRDPACSDTEVLGQGGAIYKRMWEIDGQVEYLTMALTLYLAGWQRNPEQDLGYCAINAAFILDILADRARLVAQGTATPATPVQAYRAQASALRKAILDKLPQLLGMRAPLSEPLPYWHAVKLGEAAWGLQSWNEAGKWFAQAHAAAPDEWALQATVKQLTAIAFFQQVPLDKGSEDAHTAPARDALEKLVNGSVDTVLSAHRGKVGLALSGGGFRAALYHLGVLARLAECDALRSVEVISTVSGGSIVGAQYYLALRNILEAYPDQALTRDHYLELVRKLIPVFLEGVQKNLRVRTFANFGASVRMLFDSGYTRSNRIGELYDDFLFSKADPAGGTDRRTMDELKIAPAGQPGAPAEQGFHPRFSNWRRTAKVPVLLLNATSLNSGHNWQFTASWMGEPPGLVGNEIDMNIRYRRLYYEEAPAALGKFPLGYAVAASAGVPALFAPLPLQGLYPDRTVELVDGGVHDNQGVAGLLDEGCKLILCSDACGQMDDQAKPATGIFGALSRSNSILQARVREAQLEDLCMRVKSRSLHGMMYVHLKQDLGAPPLSWIGCENPPAQPVRSSRTGYGIDRDIQQKISEIRTDLDSFTEVEAYALMASGYLTTKRQLEQLDDEYGRANPGQHWGGFDIGAASSGTDVWPFLALTEILAQAPASADPRRRDLGIQLAASREMFGKVWLLNNVLRTGAVAGIAGIVLALTYLAATHVDATWTTPQFTLTLGGIITTVVLFGLSLIFPAVKFLRLRKAGQSWLIQLAAASFGIVFCNVHLWLFDPLYLRRGKLARLLGLGSAKSKRLPPGFGSSLQDERAPGQVLGGLVLEDDELDTVKP
jgi:predicted acylesterase/phospholipase RssA